MWKKRCSVNQSCAETCEKAREKEATPDFEPETMRRFRCLKRDDSDAAMGGVESSRQERSWHVAATDVNVERVNAL